MPKETVKQRDKRKLDLQLDRELEGTFPASDPLTITRFPRKRPSAAKLPKVRNAPGPQSRSHNVQNQGREL
jgi:hypothetical protein